MSKKIYDIYEKLLNVDENEMWLKIFYKIASSEFEILRLI